MKTIIPSQNTAFIHIHQFTFELLITLLFADMVVVSDLKKNIDTPIHSPPNCQPIKTRALFSLQIYLRDTSQNGGRQAVEGEEKNQKERESFGRGGREGVFPSPHAIRALVFPLSLPFDVCHAD